MKKSKKKYENGITLIALVITIIVMVILSIMVINLAFSQDGIISKVKESTKKHEVAEEQEVLEMDQARVAMFNSGNVPIDNLKKAFEENDIVQKVSEVSDGKLLVLTKKEDMFLYDGEKIEHVVKEDVKKAAKESEVTFGDVIWIDGKASISLKTKSACSIQYQVNDYSGTWTTGTKVRNLNHNDVVYARLMFEDVVGEVANITIKDDKEPEKATIQVIELILNDGYEYYNGDVTVKITAGKDNESGVQKVIYSVSGDTTIPDQEITSGGTFTITEDGIYTITAITYDKVDNISTNTEVIKVCKLHDNDVTTNEATCIVAGLTTTICKKCGNSLSESSPVLGHDYLYSYYDEEKHIITCSRCDFESMEIHGETYKMSTAYKHKKYCSKCKKYYGDEEDHSGGNRPTCTTGAYCSKCNYCYSKALGHSWGTWVTTKAEKCTTPGSKKHTCSSCGKVETASIPSLGHDYKKSCSLILPSEKECRCSRCNYCKRCKKIHT